MKASAQIRFISAAIAAVLLATSCAHQPRNPRSQLLLDEQANALKAKVLLTELRGGRITNALELLERQIDCSVVMTDSSLSKVTGPERDTALGTLRSLRAYREMHPRRCEATIPETDNEDMARKATRILSELK